jgi:hypothetical protein
MTEAGLCTCHIKQLEKRYVHVRLCMRVLACIWYVCAILMSIQNNETNK